MPSFGSKQHLHDPLFGLKLSGNLGRFTFATLSASDRAPGQVDSSDPNFGERKGFNIARDAFDRLSTGERVYTVNILNTMTTYQISRRFSLRGIAQYDSSKARVLTDFLGFYELVPGTVAYAGYGALYERRTWDGQPSLPGAVNYVNTERGVFSKVSYLHRF